MIKSPLVRFVIRIAVYCLPVLAALKLEIMSDPDIWWHARTGQWILQHGTVPVTDPFSTFGAGKTWFAYSWAFDLLLYRLQQKFGLAGYVGYVAVLTLAIGVALFSLVERFEPRFSRSSILTAIGLFIMVPVYTPRSWLFTILFFLLLLHVLAAYRDGNRRVLLLLPPLFFIWANIHIQFVYGLVVLAIACIEAFAQKYAGDSQVIQRRRDLPKIWLLCVIATFVNPYGLWLYRTVAIYARQHPALIQEMEPLKIHALSEWLFLITLLIAVFALGKRGQVRLFSILFLAFGVVAAFKAGRDIWVATLAVVYILAESQQPRPSKSVRVPIAAVCASLLLIVATARLRNLSETRLKEFVSNYFPAKAVEVVSQNHYSGPLYNDYDWGGYLIWELPQLPVTIDGRMDVQGDAHLKQNYTTWMAGPEWTADPELRKANVVIANKKLPLTSVLLLDPEFEAVHQDAISVVFLRRSPKSPQASGGQ